MHFSLAFVGILICLTIECNGQFKIIGLLDTKSDSKNGNFEKIRLFDSVSEQLPPNDDVQEGRDLTEALNIPESVEVNKETNNNVNFVKPYDVTTNDWKNIEVTSEDISTLNNTSKVFEKNDKKSNEHSKGKDVVDSDDLEYISEVEKTSESIPLLSTATSNSKSYRNIAWILERQQFTSTVDLWKTKIDASHNYWNYNTTLAVSGRIRDRADDPLLLEVQFMPYHMNNQSVLDGKCPPGGSLLGDSCYVYIGAPMTFHEARDFCRSDNASLPFVRGDLTELWMCLQRQMSDKRYPEKVWVQDLEYLEQCTSFIYRNIEIDPCNSRRGFLCEMDPRVVIDPLSWQADLVAISVISSSVLAILLLLLFGICWYTKSRLRHVQRLERRNSIIGVDPGTMRRRNFNVSRSTDTLTKSTVTDYKKIISNGSIDSVDKSVLSSEISYDIYEAHQQQYGNGKSVSSNADPKFPDSPTKAPVGPKIYGLPTYSPQGFELSYRNEGFRDNSTYSGTRNNSVGTYINEDTPIMHQIDPEDSNSDYYGNSSTLPMRVKGDNLSFLSELKNKLPDYEKLPKQKSVQSSFIPTPPESPYTRSPSSNTSQYERQVKPSTAQKITHEYQKPEVRRPNTFTSPSPDIRRPD